MAEDDSKPKATAAALLDKIDVVQAQMEGVEQKVVETAQALHHEVVTTAQNLKAEVGSTAQTLADVLAERNAALDEAADLRQSSINEKLTRIEKGVNKLNVVVIEGNGTQSLVTRAATLEANVANNRRDIDGLYDQHGVIFKKLDVIGAKVDAIGDNSNQAAQAAIDRERADAKDRKGWLVAVIVGALTAAGNVLPLLFGR